MSMSKLPTTKTHSEPSDKPTGITTPSKTYKVKAYEPEMLEELSALVAEYAGTNPHYARYNMDAAYVKKAIEALGGSFKSVVAVASTGELVGFVVGVLAELIMCPGELTLTEVAWYVRPESRRVGVGKCLRQGFCLFAQMNGAAQVVVSLAKSSEVPYSSMEGDGFVPLSTSFILRVPCVSPLLSPLSPLEQPPQVRLFKP